MLNNNEIKIDESYDRTYGLPDEEDEALLRHVLLDDEPRQGLHRHGDPVTNPCPDCGHPDQTICSCDWIDRNG